MTTKIICDMCGKEMNKPYIEISLNWDKPLEWESITEIKRFDICEKCGSKAIRKLKKFNFK